jgi:SAM-dependent methyltransferase
VVAHVFLAVGWDALVSAGQRMRSDLVGGHDPQLADSGVAIESHYGIGYERSRLFPSGRPSLEYVRSIELLDRLLPPPPTRLLDVGGGPGTYAAPLARRGYRVHLVDPVPLHVQQARGAAGDGAGGFTAALGDARELPQPDESQDAVVLFGPLYHLTEAADRARALAEARRVLRPGGCWARRPPAGHGHLPVRFAARRAVPRLAE